MDILYLTSNAYAPFTGVSITSLFMNNRHVDCITVWVIDDGIDDINKNKMRALADQYNRMIHFLDLSEGISILEKLRMPKYRNSYATYLKLFAINLLPDSVGRILFIDSDTIVVGKLDELTDIDMQGCVLGAVRDGICNPYKIALGYAEEDSWFNMGVMLIDVHGWKKAGIQNKIIQQLKKRRLYIAADQDVLNITLHGSIMTLHPKYNATPHHYIYKESDFRKAFPQKGFYDDLKIMEEAQKETVIRHFERFVGESAWHLHTAHPYARLFDEYLEKSLWNDYQKQPAKLGLVMRIENTLYRILPHRLFLYIYAYAFKEYLLKTNKKMLKQMEEK